MNFYYAFLICALPEREKLTDLSAGYAKNPCRHTFEVAAGIFCGYICVALFLLKMPLNIPGRCRRQGIEKVAIWPANLRR